MSVTTATLARDDVDWFWTIDDDDQALSIDEPSMSLSEEWQCNLPPMTTLSGQIFSDALAIKTDLAPLLLQTTTVSASLSNASDLMEYTDQSPYDSLSLHSTLEDKLRSMNGQIFEPMDVNETRTAIIRPRGPKKRKRGGDGLLAQSMSSRGGENASHHDGSQADYRTPPIRPKNRATPSCSPRVDSSGKRVPSSVYRGVTANGTRWKAQIRYEGTVHCLGTFYEEAEAARAYDIAARIHHGEKAKPNFPEDLSLPPPVRSSRGTGSSKKSKLRAAAAAADASSLGGVGSPLKTPTGKGVAKSCLSFADFQLARASKRLVKA